LENNRITRMTAVTTRCTVMRFGVRTAFLTIHW
jgi:hypothetical protein